MKFTGAKISHASKKLRGRLQNPFKAFYLSPIFFDISLLATIRVLVDEQLELAFFYLPTFYILTTFTHWLRLARNGDGTVCPM